MQKCKYKAFINNLIACNRQTEHTKPKLIKFIDKLHFYIHERFAEQRKI